MNFLYDKSKITFDKKLSPLLVACFIGKVEIIQLLFSNEYLNVNMHSEDEGYTPLMVALYKGYYEVTKLLLDNGADVNRITKSGHYPILFSFSRLEDDKYKYENRTLCMIMIELMLSKGADLNIRVDNNPGYNILMKLVSAEIEDEESFQSTVKIVKFLIERGANKNMTTLNGLTLNDTIKSDKYKQELTKMINSTEQIFFYSNNSNNFNTNTNTQNSDVKSPLVSPKKTVINKINPVILENSSFRENCCNIF